MQLTILGCRAGMPADGTASSGYLVETAAGTLLLDCGPGVATVLNGATGLPRPDAVVISHLHLDHVYDLLPLGRALLAGAVPAAAGLAPPEPITEADPIPVLAPRGAIALFTALARLFPLPAAPALERVFELALPVTEYTPDTSVRLALPRGEVAIELVALRHAVPNCGVRVRCGDTTLAYTGDTGPTDALVTLARDVDLLVAEATLAETDHGPHGHLCAADAGRAAAGGGARALLLTHLGSFDGRWLRWCREQAAAHFAGPVDVARPLDTRTVERAVGVAS